MSRVLLEQDIYAINSVIFHEDSIIVGVNGPFVYHCLFSGDVTVKMPTTPLRVYNLCLQKKDKNKVRLRVNYFQLRATDVFIISLAIGGWWCRSRHRHLCKCQAARSGGPLPFMKLVIAITITIIFPTIPPPIICFLPFDKYAFIKKYS